MPCGTGGCGADVLTAGPPTNTYSTLSVSTRTLRGLRSSIREGATQPPSGSSVQPNSHRSREAVDAVRQAACCLEYLTVTRITQFCFLCVVPQFTSCGPFTCTLFLPKKSLPWGCLFTPVFQLTSLCRQNDEYSVCGPGCGRRGRKADKTDDTMKERMSK